MTVPHYALVWYLNAGSACVGLPSEFFPKPANRILSETIRGTHDSEWPLSLHGTKKLAVILLINCDILVVNLRCEFANVQGILESGPFKCAQVGEQGASDWNFCFQKWQFPIFSSSRPSESSFDEMNRARWFCISSSNLQELTLFQTIPDQFSEVGFQILLISTQQDDLRSWCHQHGIDLSSSFPPPLW